MAPSPQHDSEPKAPDKSGSAAAQSTSEPRNTPGPSTSVVQLAEGKHVDGLDDGQLRALLDEAITYKCPKDREGKSLLFKELLEEAEQDEEEEGGGGGAGGWRGARDTRGGGRRGRRGERLPHSSSLQDLVAAALAADMAPQRRSRHAPVSTRTQHGGSLPSGVDRSFLLGEEPVRGGGGADYIATVRCVNPPPLTERRVSVSDAHCSGTEMDILNRSKIPSTSVTYTSRATLDINSGAGGRAHTTTTCSNQQSGHSFPKTDACVQKIESDLDVDMTADATDNATAVEFEREQCSRSDRLQNPIQHLNNVNKIDVARKESNYETAAGTQSDNNHLQLDLCFVDKLEDAFKLLNHSRSFQLVKCKTNIAKVATDSNVDNIASSRSETSFNITQTTEQVDSGITFGCITTPAVVTSCNTTSSAPSPCASVDSKPRSVITTSINGLASLSRNYGAAGSSASDDFKKMDENGNALQTFNSPLSGSSHKKPRKKKSSKNETVAMSEQIDGYQGNKELSEVLRFIESDAEHGRTHKHKHHHDDDKAGKKRSTERRTKDKADKIQRANSMEELSLTKLEDLTHDKSKGDLSLRKHKKERVSDGGDTRKSERRSWGDESRAPYFHSNSEEPQTEASPPALAHPPPTREKKNKSKQNKSSEWPPVTQDVTADPPLETLEFQTVTKKKRTRKRHSPHEGARGGAGGPGGGAEILYRKLRAPSSPDRRRKSAPPSDKSNDSNDDLDSVHSLPAEPTAERCTVRPGSASSGGTPQASYADIARTRHNIPDLIESCNFYTDLESPVRLEEKPQRRKEIVCRSDSAPIETRRTPPKTVEEVQSSGPAYDVENYPALETRAHRTAPRSKETKPPLTPSPPKQMERRTKPPVEQQPQVEQKAACVVQAANEERADAVSEPPDVVLAPDRRPPVILLDEASRPREMDGITFGFDINEQLLNGEHRDTPAPPAAFPSTEEFPPIKEKRSRARCDLVRDALIAGSVPVRAGRAALRYLPPAPLSPQHDANLEKLALYVQSVWEDIVKCPESNVRYFNQ